MIQKEKEKMEALCTQKEKFLTGIKENYDLDDEDYDDLERVEDEIASGEIMLEWRENRDYDQLDSLIAAQKLLISDLELLQKGNPKAVHNANKAFEELVRYARRVKKEAKDDIAKSQEFISSIDEIIRVCDENRKK